jgi:hypothetical protein
MKRLLPLILLPLAALAEEDAVVHVTLRAPGYTAANAPEFARVKYNKAAPLGIISDDMGVGDYVSTWLFFNGYPVDPDLCYPYLDGEAMLGAHLLEEDDSAYFTNARKAGMERGSRLGVHEPLVYSDGAGGVRRFAATTALWPQSLASANYTMLSAADCRIMRRTGWSFAFHDVDGADTTDAASIAARFAPLSDLFEEAVGVPLKVLAEPNGNHVYLDAARLSPAVCWSIFQNSAAGWPFNSLAIADWTSGSIPTTFDSKPQGGYHRAFFQGSEASLTNAVDAVVANGTGANIVLGGTHGLGVGIQDWLRASVQPSDAIWVASVDEIWEYYWLHANAAIENVLFDAATDTLSFDVRLPDCGKSLFREVTVNLPGLASASDWTFSGADTADAAVVDGTTTLNVGVDPRIVGDIEAILDMHERAIRNECILRDAQYLIDRLAPSAAKDALQARADTPWRYSYCVSDNLGNIVAAAPLTEPATVSYSFPRFRLVGTKLWRVDPLPSAYGGSFTVDDDTPTRTVDIVYRHSPGAYVGANDVVLFAEGEDLADASSAVGGAALSMQAGARPPAGGALVATNLPPGVYRAVLGVWNGNSANRVTWTLSAAGETVYSAQNNNLNQVNEKSTAEFSLPRGGVLAVSAAPTYGAASLTDDNLLDYLYVRRVGDVDTSPALGAISAATTHTNATLSVAVDSLGLDCDAATLSVSFGCATQTLAIAATGAFEFVFGGLAPATEYAWTATLASDGGEDSAAGTATTAERLPAVMLGPASAAAEDGRPDVALAASLALRAGSASIALVLDGATNAVWTETASGMLSRTVSVRPGTAHTFAFVAEAEGELAVSAGSFVVYAVSGWFDVRWTEDGYPEGAAWDADPAAQAASGGAWTRPAEDASVLAGGRLALAATNGTGALLFTPAPASSNGVDLVVEGIVDARDGAPAAPDGAPLAGLSFASGGVRV